MMPIVELQWLLKKCASRETSAGADQWAEDNPLYGHCAVAATVAQDFLGGKIISRFFPAEWAERFKNRSHYWNALTDGAVVDFSRDQFPQDFPLDDFMAGKLGESRGDTDMREYLLSVEATKNRYGILRDRTRELLKANPIFLDEKFQKCWGLAFSEKAKCPKMRFACLVYEGQRLVAEDVNRLMTEQFGKERFCSLDGSRCARLDLPHRVDATVGDCGHAPIWCLRRIWELGYATQDLPLLDFYEGGFLPDGSPWSRSEPSYTCTYCQNIFCVFGLDKIWGVYDGRWTPLWTKDSFYSCAGYTLGEKKV